MGGLTQPLGRQGRLAAVIDDLRRQIASGVLPVGAQMPPERHLAAHYGLARNTLRRVLLALEEEGLLERLVGRGTFVRNRPAQAPPAPPSGAGIAVRLRGTSPADLMDVRLVIEPQVAALAASRATAADLARLDEALKRSLAAKGLAEFEHWDGALHLAIFRAAKNAILQAWCEAINQVRNEPDWYRLKKRSLTPERRHAYDREHAEVVGAIRDRDPESARRLLLRHLTRVRDGLLGLDEPG